MSFPKKKSLQTPALEIVQSPSQFFKELIQEANAKSNTVLVPEVEIYMIHLLQHFMNSDALYIKNHAGQYSDEPLAVYLKNAIETPQPEFQEMLFRQLGDVTLVRAGFFQEHLNRKAVGLNYYIGMGETAYNKVAEVADSTPKKKLYENLANGFSHCVELLAEISDRTFKPTYQNLLGLVDAWTETKSERAAKKLQDAGIQPPVGWKKNIQ